MRVVSRGFLREFRSRSRREAVAAHTDQPWVLLYVKRWLVASLQQPDGRLEPLASRNRDHLRDRAGHTGECHRPMRAYKQVGSIGGLADHFGVPRHTAQGWARSVGR
jgi:hypothetical protein